MGKVQKSVVPKLAGQTLFMFVSYFCVWACLKIYSNPLMYLPFCTSITTLFSNFFYQTLKLELIMYCHVLSGSVSIVIIWTPWPSTLTNKSVILGFCVNYQTLDFDDIMFWWQIDAISSCSIVVIVVASLSFILFCNYSVFLIYWIIKALGSAP